MIPFPHSDDPSDAHEGDRAKAESTFAWFAARREAGEGPDFEDFVAEHPGQEEELRALHATWSQVGGEGSPASGKMITPADIAWALCVGADFCVSARGFMFALGCIQALQCNKNTCPTGITTHNKRLQKGLNPQDKAVRVANYAKNMAYEVGIIAHSCGVKEPRELRRFHARVVGNNGLSIPLNELHPDIEPPGREAVSG